MKPLLPNIANNILNNLTNSDLIQDEDWEQVEHEDLQDNAFIKHP
jgi:leucyl-tRNA synthetase